MLNPQMRIYYTKYLIKLDVLVITAPWLGSRSGIKHVAGKSLHSTRTMRLKCAVAVCLVFCPKL
jgi:hypothetical protein